MMSKYNHTDDFLDQEDYTDWTSDCTPYERYPTTSANKTSLRMRIQTSVGSDMSAVLSRTHTQQLQSPLDR